MRKLFRTRNTLMVLLSTLALVSVACSKDNAASLPNQAASAVSASPASSTQKQPTITKQSAKSSQVQKTQSPDASEVYQQAIDIAMGANTISQSAVSREDWRLVASQWQQAINFLKAVPTSHRQYATAQKKLGQYQRNLADANVKATPPPKPKKNDQSDINPKFFSVPIKGRYEGIPIVEVTFNSTQKFEMLFDTGATGTLITRSIAYTLALKPVGLTKAAVADGAVVVLPLTVVKSMEIDGRLMRNVEVAVAPPALPIGLLGQDFFEGYDITIKEYTIEFRRRS